MRGLPAISPKASLRTRRWDALVLGGATPGLVAAALLGRSGARVLVVEEEVAARAWPGLREPFFITAAAADEVLGACLQALGVPLIDQRGIQADPVAYQVVLPDARVEVGDAARTVEELSAWGFLEPERGKKLVRALAAAGALETRALLGSPLVRSLRRRGIGALLPQVPAAPESGRGLPGELAELPASLGPFYAAQLRALSNLGASAPPPEAQSRLLGSALRGGGVFPGGLPGLRALLRRRVEATHGEFRSVRGRFRLVAAAGQPGIAIEETGEVWVGRNLILNAPRAALATCVEQDPIPELLAGPRPSHRRLALHFRLPREQLPAGMAARVILMRDPARPAEGTNVVSLQVFARAEAREALDLVAAAVVAADGDDPVAREAEVEAAVRGLLPFAAGALVRERTPAASWDCDALLADPENGSAWPRELELRISSRPPAFALERASVAALGFEGDLLLGWKAGEAIAAEPGLAG